MLFNPNEFFFVENCIAHTEDNASPQTRREQVIVTWSFTIILLYVTFCTIMAISRQKEARSRDYALLLFRMTSRVFYSAQYHRQHCTLHDFEQFGALYMHKHNDKYPSRSGFEPGTPRLRAQVDTKEPSGPAWSFTTFQTFIQWVGNIIFSSFRIALDVTEPHE